jgi:peroxin-11B
MRVGKNVEHFRAAAVAADSKALDPVLKYCAVGRQLGYGLYLSLDMLSFVSAPGKGGGGAAGVGAFVDRL